MKEKHLQIGLIDVEVETIKGEPAVKAVDEVKAQPAKDGKPAVKAVKAVAGRPAVPGSSNVCCIKFSLTQNHHLDKGAKIKGKERVYQVTGSSNDENSRELLYTAKVLGDAIHVEPQAEDETDQVYHDRRFAVVGFDLNNGATIL